MSRGSPRSPGLSADMNAHFGGKSGTNPQLAPKRKETHRKFDQVFSPYLRPGPKTHQTKNQQNSISTSGGILKLTIRNQTDLFMPRETPQPPRAVPPSEGAGPLAG